MSLRYTKTTASGLNWNEMLGLLQRLKKDGQYFEYLLLGTGCFLGLRAKDLLSLTWNDVLDKDELQIIESKTGKIRHIFINNYLKDVFNEVVKYKSSRLDFHTDSFLFTNRNGNKISIQYINRLLKATFQKYGVRIQNASTHTLRKTFGKRVWEMDGKSERSLIYLSQIFNHSNSKITRRYIGIEEENIKNIYLNL